MVHIADYGKPALLGASPNYSAKAAKTTSYTDHNDAYERLMQVPIAADIELVHMQAHLPKIKHGFLVMDTPLGAGLYPRASMHWTLDSVVESHMLGDWNDKLVAIKTNFAEAVHEWGAPNDMHTMDTWWYGKSFRARMDQTHIYVNKRIESDFKRMNPSWHRFAARIHFVDDTYSEMKKSVCYHGKYHGHDLHYEVWTKAFGKQSWYDKNHFRCPIDNAERIAQDMALASGEEGMAYLGLGDRSVAEWGSAGSEYAKEFFRIHGELDAKWYVEHPGKGMSLGDYNSIDLKASSLAARSVSPEVRRFAHIEDAVDRYINVYPTIAEKLTPAERAIMEDNFRLAFMLASDKNASDAVRIHLKTNSHAGYVQAGMNAPCICPQGSFQNLVAAERAIRDRIIGKNIAEIKARYDDEEADAAMLTDRQAGYSWAKTLYEKLPVINRKTPHGLRELA